MTNDPAVSAITHDQWQPIETAPKDGTSVLVFDEGVMMVSTWIDNGRGVSGWWDSGIIDPPPSHWMPLPAEPRAALLSSDRAVKEPDTEEVHDDDVLTRVHQMDQVTHSPTAASNEVE